MTKSDMFVGDSAKTPLDVASVWVPAHGPPRAGLTAVGQTERVTQHW